LEIFFMVISFAIAVFFILPIILIVFIFKKATVQRRIHEYDASIIQETVTLPKAGRYKIWIERHGASGAFEARLKAQFSASLFSDRVNFSVTQVATNKQVPFVNGGFGHNRTVTKVLYPAGTFEVPQSGEYLITNLQVSSSFLPNDRIVIAKS